MSSEEQPPRHLERRWATRYSFRAELEIEWGSAVLRGSYHLYQGWGGFVGNLILGVAFGSIFLRWRRTWPLVVAHITVDVLAGVAYIAFRGHCFFHACIR